MLKRRRINWIAAMCAAIPLAAIPGPIAAIPGGNMVLSIIGIGFLIFIHEWGHFYACRLTGTRTETFSIGFGPRLFGWEKDREGNRRFTTGARQLDPEDHAMDFRIAAIPLGGYVKMAGELPGEASSGAPDEFPQKSASARAFIISAGVIMNFLTAIVFYSIAYGAGKPYEPAVIAKIMPGSVAQEAGLQAGDRVLSIGGRPIQDRIDLLTEAALMSRSHPVEIAYERDGRRGTPLTMNGRYDEELGRMVAGIQVPGFTLTIGEGDNQFVVGAREKVTVTGVPYVGGYAAGEAINILLRRGNNKIPVQVGDRTTEVVITPLEKAPEKIPAKIGITSYAKATVSKVWGAAADVLQKDDWVVAIVTKEGVQPLGQRSDIDMVIAAASPVVSLSVQRGEGEAKGIDLALSDAESVRSFFDTVSLNFAQQGARILPLDGTDHHYEVDGVYFRLPGNPAKDAGLQDGDEVVQIGARDIGSFADIIAALGTAKADESVDVWVKDGTDRRKVVVTATALVPVGKPQSLVMEPVLEHHEANGFFGALTKGAGRTWREVNNVFRTIGALFEGRLSFQKNIAGPITLVRASKVSAERGPLRLVWFLAYISVMLAVVNILPIPVLDGGHLLFILIEKIKGSPLSDSMMIRFQQVGLLMLLALMFFAFKNDIGGLLK